MRFLAFFAAAALFSARPATAQTGPALELSALAQQIEESCPELVRFDAATGLRSLRPALLLPALRQIGQQLAAETSPTRHQSAYEATDTEAQARVEALRVLLTQLQRAQQLSRLAK